MGGAVPEGVLESIHDLPAVIDREAFVRQRGADDVAAQAFEGIPVMGFAPGARMEGESREPGDAGVVGRRVGADGAQRQCLATGVGAGGDAVVDGGAEELLEIVGGLDVEGGGIVVALDEGVEWGLLGAVPFVRGCVAGQSRSRAGGHRSFAVMGVGPGCGPLRERSDGAACRVT